MQFCTKLLCVRGFGVSVVMMGKYVPLNVRRDAMEDVKSDSHTFPQVSQKVLCQDCLQLKVWRMSSTSSR